MRLVTGEARDPPLDAELAAARDVLTSAGIDVRGSAPEDLAPGAAAAVLVPVVREAVTNVLKHSRASYCVLEMTAGDGLLRLLISNDGSNDAGSAPLAAAGRTGSGLGNLAARVEAAGGQLSASGTAESSAWSPRSRWPGSRAHRANQRRRRHALEQEPGNARGGRPAPVIRRLEGGQHDHLAVRQPPGQFHRGGKAVRAGHADVQQRDIGKILDRGRHDAGAGRHLGDHLDAVLQGNSVTRVSRRMRVSSAISSRMTAPGSAASSLMAKSRPAGATAVARNAPSSRQIASARRAICTSPRTTSQPPWRSAPRQPGYGRRPS